MADHKKIGIMGGTFNPIHFGHLLLAETAFHQFQLDEILIMPTKNPYYKKISNSVTEEDRVAMAELAIEDNGHFRLSKEELNREGNPDDSSGREMDFSFIVDIGGSCMERIRRYTRPTLMQMP